MNSLALQIAPSPADFPYLKNLPEGVTSNSIPGLPNPANRTITKSPKVSPWSWPWGSSRRHQVNAFDHPGWL